MEAHEWEPEELESAVDKLFEASDLAIHAIYNEIYRRVIPLPPKPRDPWLGGPDEETTTGGW